MYERLRLRTADMISPLVLQGLHGRQLVHPSRDPKSKRTIVFVYGIHGSLERFYGVIHFLARFGTVLAPDLPGFGGMEAYYKVGRKPTLDAYGDYLAEYIELHAPAGQFTLVGLSYGLVVATRMLVRHPQLAARVQMAVSLMGLAEGSDLAMNAPSRAASEILLALARWRLTSRAFQYIAKQRWVLNLSYPKSHPKMKALGQEKRTDYIEFESYLWGCNDMRTWGTCLHELLNLTQPGAHVPLKLHHIATNRDHWLNVPRSEEHLRKIYDQLVVHYSAITNHGGVAYEDEAEAYDMIPPEMTKLLENTL